MMPPPHHSGHHNNMGHGGGGRMGGGGVVPFRPAIGSVAMRFVVTTTSLRTFAVFAVVQAAQLPLLSLILAIHLR